MLPKERVIAALTHREGDRVPIGEMGADWEIVERALGRPTFYRSKWKEWVAEWEGRRDEVVASYQRDIPDLARAFGWDFVVVPLVPARRERYRRPEMLGPYTWRDEQGRVWSYAPEAGGQAMLVEAPPLQAVDVVVPERVRIDASRLEAIEHVVKTLGPTHFVFGRAPDGTFPWAETVGMEEYLVRMASDEEFTARTIAAALKTSVAWIDAIADTGVDGIIVGTDYCDNFGPLMGPRLFRRYVLPAFQETVKAIHARGKHAVKHTDGNTWSILDDFVAAGVDGWQGIQPRIGMDLKRLKEQYAGRLCLFGGVNCETLTLGTPSEAEAEVRYAIRHAAPGGGLVLTSGNTLQLGTRWENYTAMRAAHGKYGRYPITG
jgi:uroporphyrinogen decarboxylase